MVNVQEIFNKIRERQGELKTLKQIYKDVLTNSQEYQNIIEELDSLKIKKNKIEENLKSDLRSEIDKMYSIKIDIESEKEILNQATLTKILKGEPVELVDEQNNKYEPVFNVRFKKY